MNYLSKTAKWKITHLIKQGKPVSEMVKQTGLSYEKVKSYLDELELLKSKRIASKYSKNYEKPLSVPNENKKSYTATKTA